jgi:hypothetical protein
MYIDLGKFDHFSFKSSQFQFNQSINQLSELFGRYPPALDLIFIQSELYLVD